MNKLKLFLAIPLLALSSCGDSTVYKAPTSNYDSLSWVIVDRIYVYQQTEEIVYFSSYSITKDDLAYAYPGDGYLYIKEFKFSLAETNYYVFDNTFSWYTVARYKTN